MKVLRCTADHIFRMLGLTYVVKLMLVWGSCVGEQGVGDVCNVMVLKHAHVFLL